MDEFTRRIREDSEIARRFMPDSHTLRMLQDQASIAQQLLPGIRIMQNMFQQVNLSNSLLSQTNMLQRIAEQATLAQQFLLPEISLLQKIAEQTNITGNLLASVNAMPKQLIRNTDALALAYSSLSRIPWANIGAAIPVDEDIRVTLGNNFLSFSNSYLALSQSIGRNTLESQLASAIPALSLSEVEFFNEVDLLEAVSVQEADQGVEQEETEEKQSLRDEILAHTIEQLEPLLNELDAELIPIWKGAEQALTSINEDRTRHCLISLRELFTHVIHQLSPDDQVKNWSTSPEHYDDKGNLIRKARLLFIYRDINYDPLRSFVEKDIATILSLWDILNRVHQVAIPLSQRQLAAMTIRVEGALWMLLTTANQATKQSLAS